MVLRVIAICFAGWILASGCAALAGVALRNLGMEPREAMLTTALLSFLVYIAIVMWGFADRRSIVRPVVVTTLAIAVAAAAGTLVAGFAGT